MWGQRGAVSWQPPCGGVDAPSFVSLDQLGFRPSGWQPGDGGRAFAFLPRCPPSQPLQWAGGVQLAGAIGGEGRVLPGHPILVIGSPCSRPSRPPRGPGSGWHPPSTLCFLPAAATRVACAQEGRAFRVQSCPCVLKGSGRGRCWGALGEEVLVLSLGVPGLDQSWSHFIEALAPLALLPVGRGLCLLGRGAGGCSEARAPTMAFPLGGGGLFTQGMQPPGQLA